MPLGAPELYRVTPTGREIRVPESGPEKRLKFFGLSDYGTFWQADRLLELVREFDATRDDQGINDIVELHHLALFLEHKVLPKVLAEAERDAPLARIPEIRKAIGRFFGKVTDASFSTLVQDVDFQYRTDVLDLLGKNKVFERCTDSIVLAALQEQSFHPHDLLSCQPLVRAYDQEIRALLLAGPRNAELLARKFLQSEGRDPIHLPKSFTPADQRDLFDRYLDEEEPNLNFVKLIASARADKNTGVDARLKLKARRKADALTKKMFESAEGIKTGCEVGISADQVEEVVQSLDGMVGKYSYSRTWLTENLDYPTILNNFVHLFQFANDHMLLELPSYGAQLGVFERFMGTPGKGHYRTGAAFRLQDQASLLQTLMYERFLSSEGIELESVIAWFFTDYLEEEFGAKGLKYRASSPTATYLEKSRHLFSEMESVLKQFTLHVDYGEVDPELLTITSQQLSYGDIPSQVVDKYAYVANNADIQGIQHLLFSDQSGLVHISSDLEAESFLHLVIANDIAYDQFHEYQQSNIDFLVEKGILTGDRDRIAFASAPQLHVLKELWECEVTSCLHHSDAGQKAIDEMVSVGWLVHRSTLLSTAEVSYFNYFLNDKEFSNGPSLRNRYLHGSQADGDDDRVHRHTYLTALRLLVALVIKINDDFCLTDNAVLAKE